MSEQAEINCLVVANLADLEAAQRQIDDVITPMLEEAVERIFADFIKKRGWTGVFKTLDEFWLAPPEWADADGDEGDCVCHFEIDWVPRSEEDYHWLSALTGAGQASVGLYWSSDALRPAALGKLVAANRDAVAKIQSRGFAYDVGNRHALYVPVKVDRDRLLAGLREGDVAEAAEVFADALDTALSAAPLFQPLVDALREA